MNRLVLPVVKRAIDLEVLEAGFVVLFGLVVVFVLCFGVHVLVSTLVYRYTGRNWTRAIFVITLASGFALWGFCLKAVAFSTLRNVLLVILAIYLCALLLYACVAGAQKIRHWWREPPPSPHTE